MNLPHGMADSEPLLRLHYVLAGEGNHTVVLRGRVGGTDGAAARLGTNRTTLLSRMKKLGIYAKQFA